MMKKILLIVVLMIASFSSAIGWVVPQEKLTYDVMYKWGLINKKAGDVTIATSMKPGSPEFRALLTARTAKWADRFYLVRDTLKGSIAKDTFYPSYYEKIAREGGDFNHDILVYDRSGSEVKADVTVARKKKKAKTVKRSTKTLTSSGPTLDMLSAFYFMRSFDFANLHEGQMVKLTVFSGREKEILTIHFDNRDRVKIGKKEYDAFHITFTFTSGDGRKTSDNMDAWISTGPERIPLLLEGKLPVGKVRAVYSGPIPSTAG